MSGRLAAIRIRAVQPDAVFGSLDHHIGAETSGVPPGSVVPCLQQFRPLIGCSGWPRGPTVGKPVKPRRRLGQQLNRITFRPGSATLSPAIDRQRERQRQLLTRLVPLPVVTSCHCEHVMFQLLDLPFGRFIARIATTRQGSRNRAVVLRARSRRDSQ